MYAPGLESFGCLRFIRRMWRTRSPAIFSARFVRRWKMSKKRSRDIGSEIMEGIRQLKRGKIGRVVSVPPVAETRARAGLSQSAFARLLGVSVRKLQAWLHERSARAGTV